VVKLKRELKTTKGSVNFFFSIDFNTEFVKEPKTMAD